MKYSVVIPTYNHCEDFLKPCVESIIQFSDLSDLEIVISANGCTDNTLEYLQSLLVRFASIGLPNNFKYVWNDNPIGYPKATNEGIKITTGERIVLLNNDCVLLGQHQNTWLNILDKPFVDHPNCGISCIIKEYSKILKKDFAIFFCVMIDRKVFDTIGLLDESYGIGSGEDIDFCIRAEKSGFQVCEVFEKIPLPEKYYTGGFPIYHFAEGTVNDESLVKNWNSVFTKNSIKVAMTYSDDWNKKNIDDNRKVAVITPIHNDIDHVFKCLSTVKSQTYKNAIHYIYDDFSQDGLEDSLSDVLPVDSTIKYFKGNENKGQSYGRNFLIEQALKDGCEYIAFLDSDDFWKEDHLESSLRLIENNDIVYSKPFFIDKKYRPLTENNIPVPNCFIGKQLLHNNFIWISSVLAKSSCFKDNKFDSTLDSIEDWDMWINLWKRQYKFIDKEQPTAYYLCKENSQASLGSTKKHLLARKHELLNSIKLNLACGLDYGKDYINVDLYPLENAIIDASFDVQKIPYPDNSVDEIKVFHIIEHFHFLDINNILTEWYRVLKPGGRIWIETPDFLESCRSFVQGIPEMPIEEWRVMMYGHFFAMPWIPGQTHKFLFTEHQLNTNLTWAGFKDIKKLPPCSNYVMPHTIHTFLNVEAFK